MKLLLARIWRALKLPKNLQLSIMRLTQDQFLIGTTGIIFNQKDEVLLVKQTYRDTSWSLPGGYLKGKEHPQEGLEREIEEETGMTVSVDWRLKLRTDRDTARLDMCYVGTYIGGAFKKNHEVTDAQFFPFDSLPIIMEDQVVLIQEALNKKKLIEQQRKPKTLGEKVKKFFS
jgi:8-oxo-dGTP diphosphatase